MPNLLSFFGTLLLITVSLPLTSFALFTTTLALTALWLRVLVVYFELAIAFINSWFALYRPASPLLSSTMTSTNLSASSVYASHPPNSRFPNSISQYKYNRNHDTSTYSQSVPLIPSPPAIARPAFSKTPSLVSMTPSNTLAPPRDFEGVGGWREPSSPTDDDLWISFNSRLQLPSAATTPGASGPRARMHTRTPSAQSLRFGGGERQRSPLVSRRGTPGPPGPPMGNGLEGPTSPEGYFSMRLVGEAEGGDEGWKRWAERTANVGMW